MKPFTLVLLFALPLFGESRKYPPLSDSLMATEAEIALARSAAPESASSRAAVKVLRRMDTELRRKADNGSLPTPGAAAPR